MLCVISKSSVCFFMFVRHPATCDTIISSTKVVFKKKRNTNRTFWTDPEMKTFCTVDGVKQVVNIYPLSDIIQICIFTRGKVVYFIYHFQKKTFFYLLQYSDKSYFVVLFWIEMRQFYLIVLIYLYITKPYYLHCFM